MSSIIKVLLICSIPFLAGCGEKPQKTLVGKVAIAVLPPSGFCAAANATSTPILFPFIAPENIHRNYESCDADKKTMAWLASHQADHTYSNPADKFAVSMAENFEKALKTLNDSGQLPTGTKAVVEHDNLASYVIMTTNAENQYIAAKIGMTIIKGKVISYWMVNYSDKLFETTLDLSELKQWIAKAHQIN